MGYITQTMRGKLDKLAEVMVKMERGEWDYEDGRKRWAKDVNGMRVPRVVKREAVRVVWDSNSSSLYTQLFSEKGKYHAVLEERIAFHRQRLNDGYQQALATLTGDGHALSVMSSKLWESLWWDLNDEETCKKIPFRERARFFEVLSKMESSIKGDVNTQGHHQLHPQVVIQNISVPDAVKQRMMDTIEGEIEE